MPIARPTDGPGGRLDQRRAGPVADRRPPPTGHNEGHGALATNDGNAPRGCPWLEQGAVISPLLANLYLHPLDLLMERSSCRMVPCAGEPHARFRGRGGSNLPDPIEEMDLLNQLNGSEHLRSDRRQKSSPSSSPSLFAVLPQINSHRSRLLRRNPAPQAATS
jgi:hypothetical protein